jgi:Tol biopolymer transport system component
MTVDARFERDLAGLLEDLYLGPTPDYRTEVLSAAVSTRQRPSWTFPGRWLPVAEIAVRPVAVPQLPLRLVGVALIIAATILAILAVAGSQPKLPPPYGEARNGLITWANGGDIFTGDPLTNEVKRVIATDDVDRNPQFSRDGSHLAFLRQVPTQTGSFDLVVTKADGNDTKILTPVPITTPEQMEWSPDGTFLLVNEANGDLTRFSVDGGSPQRLMQGVHISPDAFRPPAGNQILYVRDDDQGALYMTSIDGPGTPVQVFGARTATCACALAGSARWSPDGRFAAFPVNPDGLQSRLWVLDVETGDARQVDSDDGIWSDGDAVWSPDGSQLAFNRWQQVESGPNTGDWVIRPVGVVDRRGGPVVGIGVAPVDNGAVLEWAPDGTTILSLPSTVVDTFSWGNQLDGSVANPTMLDVNTHEAHLVDWAVGSAASWQRLAR